MSAPNPLRLILMRHANAEAAAHTSDDHKRNLSPKGQLEAVTAGRFIRSSGWIPDLMMASDATRVRQTASGLIRGSGSRIPTIWLRSLYHCQPWQVIETVASANLSDQHQRCILLLGHNPTWSTLASAISGKTAHFLPAQTMLMSLQADSWSTAIWQSNWLPEHTFIPDKA